MPTHPTDPQREQIIQKIRELEKKATPGEWIAESNNVMHEYGPGRSFAICNPRHGKGDMADTRFIATSRQAVPALLEALDEARLEVKAFELTDRAWKTELDTQAQRIRELEESLELLASSTAMNEENAHAFKRARATLSAWKKEKKP